MSTIRVAEIGKNKKIRSAKYLYLFFIVAGAVLTFIGATVIISSFVPKGSLYQIARQDAQENTYIARKHLGGSGSVVVALSKKNKNDEIIWEVPVKSAASKWDNPKSIRLAGETLFLLLEDANGKGAALVIFNPQTGEEKWCREFPYLPRQSAR